MTSTVIPKQSSDVNVLTLLFLKVLKELALSLHYITLSVVLTVFKCIKVLISFGKSFLGERDVPLSLTLTQQWQ